MAVKKRKLVSDARSQVDLMKLAQYLQVMNDQLGCLPPAQELIKQCQDIVNCLAHIAGPLDQWELLQPIEYFLLRVVTTVNCNTRHEVFTAILDKLQTFISDPQSEASPITAAVLIILDESDEEASLSYARWLVQRTDNNSLEGAGLPAALSRLYQWLHEWRNSSALGFWLQCYIKALEEKDYQDLLIETSLSNLARLFSCLTKTQPIHHNTTNVIFHVLASLRESVEAFDRISPMVEAVLVNLASDSSQWSRQLLQDAVDILSAMVDHISCSLKGDAQDMFRDKYADVILCLERHMASRASKFLKIAVWRRRSNSKEGGNNNSTKPAVGLMNLGNTCYMNSVVQALLVTRQFSTHILRRASTAPYWEKMAELFARMMFSVAVVMNPDNFFKFIRPPFFTLNNQHDSSEFLSYLFELLQSYEHSRETNHDYSKPPVLRGQNRFRVMNSHVAQTPQLQSSDGPSEPGQSQRSISPRPGSSNGSSSNGLKRSSDGDSQLIVHKKRTRTSEATSSLRSDSVIDGMFAGVLLTRVQCTVCHASFLSRDMFRDLQLAFPEKPEGWQHSVQSLLEYYCSKESLTGDNKYACNGCGDLRDAERSVLIETTPKYLILVLKNFKFDSKIQEQAKLMQSVYYNHQVKLPTVRAQAQHTTFNLFATVIHGGTSLDTGHYYTVAKDGDQWFQYDDSLVTSIDENHINKLDKSFTPYILFYRRSDVEEPAAPSFEELPRCIRDKISAENKLYSERLRKQLSRP